MSLQQAIEQVMTEIGPVADLLVVDAYPSEHMWHLAVNEDTQIFAELVLSRGTLVLSTELGHPQAGERGTLYELLLRYAHVWNSTGGLRMSLDAPDGGLWMLLDCPAQSLTVADLSALLADFATRAQAWREIVAAHGKPGAEPVRFETLFDPAFIRA
jgi:hypothetical protein